MDRQHYFETYGIATYMFSDRSLSEALNLVADAGFRLVEISGNEAHLDPRLDPRTDEVSRQLNDRGLVAHSVHTPFSGLRLGDPDPSVRAAATELISRSLEITAAVGASVAVVHVSDSAVNLTPEQYPASIESIRIFISDLDDLAAKLGLRLALENLTYRGSPRFGCSLEELARGFPEPRIGFCLDTGHSALNKIAMADEAKAAGRRLISIHADDNDGNTDLHWLPTMGVINWQDVEEALEQIGYKGPLILEPSAGVDSKATLEQAASLWSKL